LEPVFLLESLEYFWSHEKVYSSIESCVLITKITSFKMFWQKTWNNIKFGLDTSFWALYLMVDLKDGKNGASFLSRICWKTFLRSNSVKKCQIITGFFCNKIRFIIDWNFPNQQ
jgi:hypothetical protein